MIVRTGACSRALLVAALAAAAGCATTEEPTEPVPPDPRLVPAVRQADDSNEVVPRVVEIRVPVPSPQLRPVLIPATRPPSSSAPVGPAAVAAANDAATVRPAPDDFVNATQYYDYAPGEVYAVVTCPGYLTTLALRPGERLVTAAAGDTSRWTVESVDAGSGPTAQTLLLVKPRRPDLHTNLLVTTDQRVYTLDLSSTAAGGAYHTMVAWNYPFGDVVLLRGQAADAQERARADRAATVAAVPDLTRVNFNYLVLRQRDHSLPPWAPLRAFDDGSKTYVQFPPKVAVTEAPPLFVLGRNGDAQLVNYRVKGDWYVVDRLFDRAELRLGEAPQTVVGIRRADVKD